MNISCNRCGKIHSVPDNSIKDSKVYFFCSKCSHKIVVDKRSDTSDNARLYQNVGFTDLFSGLFTFLNWPSILITALFTLLGVIFLGIVAAIVSSKLNFFMQHPGAALFLAVLIFLLFYFCRNINLYLTSKIIHYKYQNPHKSHLNWKDINFDFGEDWVTILIYSTLFTAALSLCLSPIPVLQEYGLFYSAIFFPITFLLVLLIVATLVLNRFLPAVLATGSFFVKEGVRELIRFVKSEYVELPFYVLVITAISKFFITIFSSLLLLIISLTFLFSGAMLTFETRTMFLGLVQGAGFNSELVPSHITLAFVIFAVVISVILVIFVSFCDNFIQALYVKAVQIMKMNPEESFDRKVMLIIMVLIALFILLGVIALLTLAATQISLLAL